MTDSKLLDKVENILYANLGALPNEQFGHINVLPFAVESDQTNELKHLVARAIADLLANAGLLRDREDAPARPMRDVSLNCRLCSTPILDLLVDENGVANIAAASILSTMARRNPECPHDVVTPDDQRRKIEEAVRASQ